MRKLTWPGRRTSMALGTAVVLVAGSLALSGTSGAADPPPYQSLVGSNFQIDTDANLKVDTTFTPPGGTDTIDWLSASVRTDLVSQTDDPSGGTDDSFGNGTKEDTAIPSIVDGGIPPNKSDLKKFGVYKEVTGAGSFLHLFWSRVQDPSGTTNMDFEFNKNKCDPLDLVNSICTSNGETPVRVAGDLLITYDLSRGGTVATISLRRWTGSAWGAAQNLNSATATGTINTTLIPDAESGGLGDLDPRTFGEASVNMTAILPAGQCTSFGSAYLKSRSSDSFTAALKDFIAPTAVSISNCGSIEITKTDDANAVLAGAVFKLYHDTAPLDGDQAQPRGTEDTNVVDIDPIAAGTQEATCTSAAVTGKCTISNVPIGKYWVVETTTPNFHTTALDQYVSITGTAKVELTFVNARLPGRINIHKQDDANDPDVTGTDGAALQGAVFTLYKDVAPTGGTTGGTVAGAEDKTAGNTVGTCTTDAGGDCSFTAVARPGLYWVVETTTPADHTTAADRYVDFSSVTGNATVSLTFIDPRQFKVIVLVCQESTNALYPSNVLFGTATSPTTNNSLGSAPAGLTEAQLCGLTGATLPDVPTGSYRAGITIPVVSP